MLWGGFKRKPVSFLVYDASTGELVELVDRVIDNDPDSYASLDTNATSTFYVCSPQPASRIYFDINRTYFNDNNAEFVVNAWVDGAWASVSASDGTFSAINNSSLYRTGIVEWDFVIDEKMRVLNGIMGYWYQFVFDSTPDAVRIHDCWLTYEVRKMQNRWDGVLETPTGCYYTLDGTTYDKTGDITDGAIATYINMNGADAADDYIYIKCPEPAIGFKFKVDPDNRNTADNAQVDQVDFLNAGSTLGWTAFNYETDGTLVGNFGFNRDGYLFFEHNADVDEALMSLLGDEVPGYWYRISWDAAFATDIHIFDIKYVPRPEPMEKMDGVCEFSGRAVYWGSALWPNYLRVSGFNDAAVLNGDDSEYVGPFGGSSKILLAQKFKEWLIVFKRRGIYAVNTSLEISTISESIGVASIESLQSAEAGHPSVHRDEPRNVILWQDTDGVYAFDGTKPKKISDPVGHYFDPNDGTYYMGSGKVTSLGSMIDPQRDEYHLFVNTLSGGEELVYNYTKDMWYPPWTRYSDLVCGKALRDKDGVYYLIGGDGSGYLFRLEYGSVDDDPNSVTNQAIASNIVTRAFGIEDELGPLFTSRKLYAILGATTATVYPILYKNTITSDTSLTSFSGTLSGYDAGLHEIMAKANNCFCVAFKLSVATSYLDVRRLVYEAETRGMK